MRVAIISDIHEDIISLQLALDKIERLKCKQVVCLGDISGFSVPHHDYFDTRNAHGCLKLVKENCDVIIAGNHDLHAVRKTPRISGFHYPENWYSLDYQERMNRSLEQVWLYEHEELNALYTRDDIDFIKQLPEYQIKNYNGLQVLFTHFIYPNLTGSEREFYFDPEDFAAHKKFMTQKKAIWSFAGHRHFPGLLVVCGRDFKTKNFGRKYKLKQGDTVLLPAITRARGNSGFCTFDTEKKTVQAIRI